MTDAPIYPNCRSDYRAHRICTGVVSRPSWGLLSQRLYRNDSVNSGGTSYLGAALEIEAFDARASLTFGAVEESRDGGEGRRPH